MSLRPSALTQGQTVIVALKFGDLKAEFVRRVPARGKGCPAKNYLRFPEFAGLDGSEDDGTCVMSDYDLARQGRLGQ